MVYRWAAQHRLKIISRKPVHSPLNSINFRLGVSNVQSVYRVTTQDENGQTAAGWLILGSRLFGLFSARVVFVPEAKEEAACSRENSNC
jgi:hypothetical protein